MERLETSWLIHSLAHRPATLYSHPVALLKLEGQILVREVLKPKAAERLDLSLYLAGQLQRWEWLRTRVWCKGLVKHLSASANSFKNGLYESLPDPAVTRSLSILTPTRHYLELVHPVRVGLDKVFLELGN